MSSNDHVVEKINLNQGWLIRLLPGDDFYTTITQILKEHEIKRGAFLSAIGSVTDVSYRNLKEGVDLPLSLDKTVLGEESGPFELLSLEGSFVPKKNEYQYNIHILLGTHDGKVIGGHLFGATVYSTLEIVVAEFGGSRVVKEVASQTGLPEWKLE